MPAIISSFEQQFDSAYRPSPFFGDIEYTRFGQAMLSNLLGGLGYFYGTALVDKSHNPAYQEQDPDFWRINPRIREHAPKNVTAPYELFTCVPARPLFPRGFLWDEGFHQLVIIDWDVDLSMEVVRSWLSLMDEDGWIAREQILGDEARSKVPKQYWVQYPEFANPPMLFLVVQRFMAKTSGREDYRGAPSQFLREADMTNRMLRNIYPLLKRNYLWFRKSQQGNVEATVEGYRWKGHTMEQILTSGLDDYPRAQPPHPSELHVDAISWIGLMADVLADIAGYLNLVQDKDLFEQHRAAILSSLDAIHWSEKDQNYCDTTSITGSREHVCHNGYTSLLPFITGLLSPTHPRLNYTLNFIRNESTLWTPHGLRSLSKSDPLYLSGENYWRAPIWVNFNYLVISQLLEYASAQGPLQKQARAMYSELRRNVIRTVFNAWKETGYAWEQYSQDTGKGQRTQHFNGWTTLIVKILHMPDLNMPSTSTSTHYSDGPTLVDETSRTDFMRGDDAYDDQFDTRESFKVGPRSERAGNVSPVQWMGIIVLIIMGMRFRRRIGWWLR
jgi:mannosyl-oligosaccharide glucosidase